jgi:hypothetical protein
VSWILFIGHGILYHLGCLWTLTFSGVGGGVFMYVGFMFRFDVIYSNFVSRSVLLNSGGMVGSLYIMVFAGKYMFKCVSSNLVLYGASFVVHSSSGMVSMVIVF